ncbi:MAG: redoxin family protein, partial [Clostridia bacterium]|nr:redoxin family protein [Clostridia bacterium]
AASEHVLDFPESGCTYEVPDAWQTTIGQIVDSPMDRGEVLGYDTGILFGYMLYRARTNEESEAYLAFLNELNAKDEEATAEQLAIIDEYNKRNLEIFEVYGIRDGITLDEAITQTLGVDPYSTKIELGSFSDYTYWLCIFDYEYPIISEYMKAWPQEMVDELKAVSKDVAEHPERFTLKKREVYFTPPAIGSTISFETADVDGNAVSSAELFGKNKVTLVNIWRTWCGPCIEEMPELDNILREYADKGVGVVTYCADANDDDLIATAKEIASAYGFTTLVWSKSIEAALPWNCTPMTYFVDGEGKVLGYPIAGENVEAYLATIESALSGETITAAVAPALSSTPETDEKATYTVTVLDQNGDPVPKVAVGFCTATECNFLKSDKNGVIVFEGQPYAYHVDIIKVPSGYSFTELDDIYTEANSMSMTLTITKD